MKNGHETIFIEVLFIASSHLWFYFLMDWPSAGIGSMTSKFNKRVVIILRLLQYNNWYDMSDYSRHFPFIYNW